MNLFDGGYPMRRDDVDPNEKETPVLGALLEVFDQDELRAWHALEILVAMLEAKAERHAEAEGWDQEFLYVFNKMYDALHREYRG